MKKQVEGILLWAGLWAILFLSPDAGLADDFMDKAIKPARETLEIQRRTQGAEDQWASEKERLTAKFEALEEKKKKLEALNHGARKSVEEKTGNLASLEQQMEDISKTSKEIEPYLDLIYGRLVQSVSDGLPFLAEERKKRLEKLDLILKDGSVKISEKFRRLTEALMVEAEYGGTIEVYPQTIELDGSMIQMRVLRLGRMALFCQSPDREVTGFYDLSDGKWHVLPRKYNKDLDMAIEIGAKRRVVELLTLPLGRMATR